LLNLSDLVYRVVSDHIDRRDPVHNIIHHIEPSVFVYGDAIAFSSLIVNLIENAEKYSPPDTSIEVRLTEKTGNALISVSDEGIGIPAEEHTKIFTKFYRVGNEDTRKTKGTGLGLYIVKHVIDLHKGKININSNQPKGTIFEMEFPLAANK
jgi:two-component system, OmpR family, phosphate regulon sensor histidine kinase PhoR